MPPDAGPPAPAQAVRALARAALVLAAILALFFAPALLGGGNFYSRDNGRMHAPVKRFVAAELARGRLPEWNPYAGMGAPVVAGGVDAVLHPFNLLLVALPFELAFKAWVLLSFLVGALGAWAWARALGRSEAASLLAGTAFALGGFLVSSSDNLTFLTALAALPWVFAAAHAFVARGGPGRLAALGAASAFCAAAGDPQAWAFAVALLPAYAALVVDGGASAGRRLGRGALAAVAAVVAAAPVVFPIAAWIPHSSRADPVDLFDRLRWNLHPVRAFELVLPNLLSIPRGALVSPLYEAYAGNAQTSLPWVLSVYAGISVVLLAAVGAATARPARLLAVAAAGFGWAAMGPFAGFGWIAERVPLLGHLRYWEKLAVWPGLFLAVAAAFGADRLLEARGPAARRVAVGAGAVAAALAVVVAMGFAAPEALARLVQRGPDPALARAFASNLTAGALHAAAIALALGLAATGIARGRLGPRGGALVLAIVALDLGAANARAYVLTAPDPLAARAPIPDWLSRQDGARVVTSYLADPARWPELTQWEALQRWGARTAAPAYNVAARVPNFDVYAGMVPVRASRYARRVGRDRVATAGLWAFAYAVVTAPAVRLGDLPAPEAEQIATEDPLVPAAVVALPHRPRAYLASGVVSVDRRSAMEFALDRSAAESERTVIEGEARASGARGTARIVRDDPARVEVATASSAQALLVVNDAYAEGWSATVDGAHAEILPANYLARGVWVPGGEHVVAFRYRTPWLREGAAVALAGAAALVAWAAWRRRRARRPAPAQF